MSWSWGVPPPSPPWYEHILPTLNTSHTGSSVEFDGTKQMLGRKGSENLTFFFAILFLALVLFSMLFTVVNLCMCDRKGGEAAWLADLDQPKTERVSPGRCATHIRPNLPTHAPHALLHTGSKGVQDHPHRK